MTVESLESHTEVISIRQIEVDPEVASELAELTERVYGGTYYVPGFTEEGSGWLEDQKKGKVVFAAYQTGKIVGVSCIHPNPQTNTVLLCDTMIDLNFQKNGLGSRLNEKRIKFLDENPQYLVAIVENRSHQPGSFMPLLKRGFTPLALTPDDALLGSKGYYCREYYLLSARTNLKFSVAASTCVELQPTFSLWSNKIVIQEPDLLYETYRDHPWFDNPNNVSKGAIKLIATPLTTSYWSPEFPSEDKTIIVYMTSVDQEAYSKLTQLGFRFNGIRPWIDLVSADNRPVSDKQQTIPSFIVFSRVSDTDTITMPIHPKNLQTEYLGTPTSKQLERLLLFYNDSA